MPFTPFHMGLGLAAKAVAGRHFSLTVFGVSQVAMDIEPLVKLVAGVDHLHSITHSYLFATFIACAVALSSRPMCQAILRRYVYELRYYKLGWLASPSEIPMVSAVSGAFFGTFSHVLLDSFMHHDVHPFSPFSYVNPLYGIFPIPTLHYFLLFLVAIGITVWVFRSLKIRSSNPAA